MRNLLLAALLLFPLSPARAEPPPGLADPAFTEPFARVLAGNDPTALSDLHAAAEAGNTAALLALPAVLDWLRPGLKDRRRILTVGTARLPDALAAAAPYAADWAGGNPDFTDADDLVARALRLYDAGEAEKATGFLLTWANQTGSFGRLPDGIFDRPLPVLAEYLLLSFRLNDPIDPEPLTSAALAAERLRAGSPGAAMALAQMAGMHRPDGPSNPEAAARLPLILGVAGLTPEQGQQRLAEALPALRMIQRYDLPDVATAHATVAFLAEAPDLAPLRWACAAACPETAPQCAAAWVLAFGLPQGRGGNAQPFVTLIDPQAFWSSARGIDILIARPLRDQSPDFAAGPLMTQARALDACFAATAASTLP